MDANLKTTLARIDEAKLQVDSLRPLKPAQEARIFQKFRLDWNYHSNAIEGNKLTLGETALYLAEGLTANGKPLRDHLDLSGHDEVISFLTSFIHRKEELSEAIIRQMHKVMLVKPYQVEAKTSDGRIVTKTIEIGEYKTEPNEVLTLSGAVHRFVLPQDIAPKMAELIAWYRNSSEKEHPVLAAAVFHHEFVAIHPFADGNGRMARLLMNLILMKAGFPPVIIKTEERDRYVSGLVNADNGNRGPFFEFIAEKTLASLSLYLRGARGEPLEEEDDIDKRIALFKQQLIAEPEPIIFSEEVYTRWIDRDFAPFLRTFVSKVSKFDDLFVEVACTLGGSGIPDYSTNIENILNRLRKTTGSSIRFNVDWRYFKKAGLKQFSHSMRVVVLLSRLTYKLEIGNRSIEKLYSQPLEKEEFVPLINKATEAFLLAMERVRTDASAKKR